MVKEKVDGHVHDMSMYSGSSGMYFGLWKYTRLLSKKQISKKAITFLGQVKVTNSDLRVALERILDSAIGVNIAALEAKIPNMTNAQLGTASFLLSEPVGVSTLSVLRLLVRYTGQINYDLVQRVMDRTISIQHNFLLYTEQSESLIRGTAGYLYSLLFIE